MPSSLQALIMRMAISPRLAMRIFLNRADGKQGLPVLYGLSVLNQLTFQDSRDFRFDFVHQLHGLDDAQDLARLDPLANPDEGRRAWRRALVEGAYDGRLHQREVWVGRHTFALFGSGERGSRHSGDSNRRRHGHGFQGGGNISSDADAIVAALNFEFRDSLL